MKFVEVKLSEVSKDNVYEPSYMMYYANILNASPGTIYNIYFDQGEVVSIQIGATGAYCIPISNHPIGKIELISGDINKNAILQYGYYDTSVPDNFSYISNITLADEMG
jgi:hypothetical protein